MNISALGIDVGKNVFHVFGVDQNGKPSVRKKLTRKKLFEFLVNLPGTDQNRHSYLTHAKRGVPCRQTGRWAPESAC